jgi:excisionase family DNA binding protein
MEKKFISIGEVIKLLGMSRQTVYKLLDEGMPSYKLGGRRIVDRDELIAWVKSHRNDQPKKAKRAPKRKKGK